MQTALGWSSSFARRVQCPVPGATMKSLRCLCTGGETGSTPNFPWKILSRPVPRCLAVRSDSLALMKCDPGEESHKWVFKDTKPSWATWTSRWVRERGKNFSKREGDSWTMQNKACTDQKCKSKPTNHKSTCIKLLSRKSLIWEFNNLFISLPVWNLNIDLGGISRVSSILWNIFCFIFFFCITAYCDK